MKKSLLYIVLGLLLTLQGYVGLKAYTEAMAYESATTELVAYQDASQQASLQLERIAKSLLGELYIDEKRLAIEKIHQKKLEAARSALYYTLLFMLIFFVILCTYFIISLRAFTFFASLGAMIALGYGLVTPILMVTIHKEVSYLGDIVLSFESKGIIGSITKLYEGGDIVVALVIFLFSVLTPLLKVFAMLFISLFIESRMGHQIVTFFKMIGKWSMIDVFVVAVFLVYLTANKGDVSRAEIEVGLYYFLAYVIVSMLVSLSANALVMQRRE